MLFLHPVPFVYIGFSLLVILLDLRLESIVVTFSFLSLTF